MRAHFRTEMIRPEDFDPYIAARPEEFDFRPATERTASTRDQGRSFPDEQLLRKALRLGPGDPLPKGGGLPTEDLLRKAGVR